MTHQIIIGDSREELKTLADNSIDSIVTDPPYGLRFMGKKWDYDVPDVALWAECLRVLKPGGHLLSFGGSRTFHRMAVNIEDAGFEIRDSIIWHYVSGFPKGHNISKAIDKKLGVEREVVGTKDVGPDMNNGRYNDTNGDRMIAKITKPATDLAKQWDGWNTALKPSHEPIIMARKPVEDTVVENVLNHGTGGINVDACRIGTDDVWNATGKQSPTSTSLQGGVDGSLNVSVSSTHPEGRWPANTIFDEHVAEMIGDKAKFFFVSKASKRERNEGLGNLPDKEIHRYGAGIDGLHVPSVEQNNHPTVKPIELMQYLIRLVTPPQGTVLDPFTGSGSTGVAAVINGYSFVGIEREPEFAEIAETRIQYHTPIEVHLTETPNLHSHDARC